LIVIKPVAFAAGWLDLGDEWISWSKQYHFQTENNAQVDCAQLVVAAKR
jgi:hypothetical protein